MRFPCIPTVAVVVVVTTSVERAVAWTTTAGPSPASMVPLNDEQCRRYAQRLGMDTHAIQQGGASVPKLCELTEAHLSNIPFDNLRVFGADENAPVSMQPQAMAHALVDRQRGGICFELNGLFGAFLDRLGYTVSHVPATVLEYNKEGVLDNEIPHLSLAVEDDAGNRWLVDVGMGSTSPIHPLALIMNQEQTTPEGMKSRFVQHSPTLTRLEMYDVRKEHWMQRVEFTTDDLEDNNSGQTAPRPGEVPTAAEMDFNERKAMQFENTLEDMFAEGSDFRRVPVVCKLTRTEMVSLVGGQLKVTRKRCRTDIEASTYDCKNVDEVQRILEIEFGMPRQETDQVTVPGL